MNIQLLIICLLNYFTFALIGNMIGALVPFWKEAFQLEDTSITLLNSAFFIAYGLTSVPNGLLLDRIGAKKTFILALSCVSLGSLLFYFQPTYFCGLVSLFIMGSGITALQIVGNLLVKSIDSNPANYSRNMTLTLVAAGLGGASCGVLLSQLTSNTGFNLPWSSAYLVFVGLTVLLATLVFFTAIPEESQAEPEEKASAAYRFNFFNPTLLFFALGIFLYVGIEVGIANWIGLFLERERGVLIGDALGIVSAYWLAQAIGRFTGGILMNYLKPTRALVLFAGAAIACTLGAVSSTNAMFSMGCFVAIGFFTSIMFPTIFSTAINAFPSHDSSKVAGVLSTSIAGGAFIAPVIALLSGAIGSLGLAILLCAALSFGYILFIGLSQDKEGASQPSQPETAKSSG